MRKIEYPTGHIKDYTITLEDESGRTCELSIHGDCIDEAMKRGYTLSEARESIEDNKVENAIAEGLIDYECFLISTTFPYTGD